MSKKSKTAFKINPKTGEYSFHDVVFEEISDVELQKRLSVFYTALQELHDNMDNLESYEEYSRQFSEVFTLLNTGQYIVLPNTTRIEQRAYEVFGIRHSDEYFKNK